jgi:peptidyl-prolyl cis-trans isomerase SurA
MQQEVWNKAIEDSVGAVQYYQGHLKQYKSDRRAAVNVISSRDQSVLKKLISTPNSNSSLNDLIEKTLTDQEQGLLKIVKRTIKLSEISKFEPAELTSGSWILNDNTSEYYFIEEIIPEGYFFYDEIKGQVLSDYQDFLEQQWIKKLRAKRSIQIYNDTLEEIAKN